MEQVQVTEPGGAPGRWFRSTRDFFVAVSAEMKKVSWPSRDELIKATRMVVVLAVISGVILGLVDLLLTKLLVDGVAALGR